MIKHRNILTGQVFLFFFLFSSSAVNNIHDRFFCSITRTVVTFLGNEVRSSGLPANPKELDEGVANLAQCSFIRNDKIERKKKVNLAQLIRPQTSSFFTPSSLVSN